MTTIIALCRGSLKKGKRREPGNEVVRNPLLGSLKILPPLRPLGFRQVEGAT